MEFSDHHLQPVMKEGKSFVKDTANFLDKLKDLEEKFFANIMISYYIRRSTQKINSILFIKKTSFYSKYLELLLSILNSPAPVPPPLQKKNACIFMEDIETEFFKTQSIKPWILKRFIDNVFFIWMDSEEKLKRFLKERNAFHPNITFTFEKL